MPGSGKRPEPRRGANPIAMKSDHRPLPLLPLLGTAALAVWGVLKLLEDRYEFRDKVVLITGGSRGLGLALARQLAGEGARLALLARDADELAKAETDLRARGAADVFPLVADVTNPAALRTAVATVANRFGRLDVLINNAAALQVGPLEHMDQGDFERAMNTNFWAAFHAVQAALPHLRRRAGARIVNVASFGGEVAVPHMAPYNVSKHALVGFSTSLRAELDPDGIRVLTVTPGVLRTGSHVNVDFKGRHAEEFDWFAGGMGSVFTSMGNERAARLILGACRAGRPYLSVGIQAKAARIFNGLFPNLTAYGAALVNRLVLPRPGEGAAANVPRKGRESRAPGSTDDPKFALADAATARFNGGGGGGDGTNGHPRGG